MEQVYYCLVFEHDYRFVLVAAAICLFGSATTFVMLDRAREARHRAKWLALLALCSGATVWSTHFVAMLAFEQGLTMSYALYATLGSLFAGIVGIGGGFAIALPRAGREWTAIMAGLVAGTGVIVLHYVGMSAVRLPGRITYDADLVIASVAFSLLFGGLSFYFSFARDDRRNRVLAFTCFVLMVVLLHFTAMGAVRIEPGPWLGAATPELSRETLATLVAATTIALLAVGLAGALFDRRHSRELFALAQRFRVLSDSALEGLVIHRDGAVLDSNAAARRLLALTGGPEPESIYSWFGNAPRAQVEQWLAQTADAPAEVALAGRDGRMFTAEVCGSTLQLPDGSPGQVLAIRDVTARKDAEARLHHQALHDPLTDLPNRRLFIELADKVRAQAARHGGRFAVFMLDLDNFKTVNDLHGHGGGDRLLVELARRIQADLRDSDIVARFGGDEFALIATAPEQPQDLIVLAERLLRNISRPVHLDGSEVVVSPSVGIALYPGDGQSIEELVRNADTAMYDAKGKGKGTFKFFEPGMNRALEARHAMEKGLRQAIADERLTVAYQPVIHARTRATVGFEALVRWDDETLGQVLARALHSRRRGDRPDRAARRIRAAHRLPRRRRLGNAAARRGQPLGDPVPPRGPRRDRRTNPRGDRPARQPARPRNHRIDPDRQPEAGARDPARAQGARRAHLHGRFRHRLLVAALPAELPVRQDQDRPGIHHGARFEPAEPVDRARGGGHGPQPRHEGGGRGRRDRRPGRAPARHGLRRAAGLSDRKAHVP